MSVENTITLQVKPIENKPIHNNPHILTAVLLKKLGGEVVLLKKDLQLFEGDLIVITNNSNDELVLKLTVNE